MLQTAAHSCGDYYQRFAMLSVRIGALHVLGENRRAHAELQSVLQEARATNNRSVLLHLTLCQTFDDEVQNRASHSQARLVEQRALLPKGRFGPLHVLHMLAILRTACSTNDYAWADPLLAEDWPRWQRSPVRAGGFLCLLVHSAHARYRLNRMLVQRTQEDPVALVREDLRVLGRLPFETWHTTTRCRLRARLEFLANRPHTAAELLRESLANMPEGALAEAARDRHALGFAVGGEEGARLRAEANAFLKESGMADPMADMQAHYPEFLR